MQYSLLTTALSRDEDLPPLRAQVQAISTVLELATLERVQFATAVSEAARVGLLRGRLSAEFILRDTSPAELVVGLRSPRAHGHLRALSSSDSSAPTLKRLEKLVDRFDVLASDTETRTELVFFLPRKCPDADVRARLVDNLTKFVKPNLSEVFEQQNKEMLQTIDLLNARQGELEQANARLQATLDRMQQMEELALRNSRLESVARLSAGIAHHFNNLLTPIIGFTQLALDTVLGSETEEYLQQVGASAESAALITRQLLAFGQRQMVKPTTLDIHQTMGRMTTSIELVLGSRIHFKRELDATAAFVTADEVQIEHAVMSIVQNAHEAMRGAGSFTLTSRNVILDDGQANALEVAAGSYAQLSIADSGCGMEPDVVARVFDPFFTTKSMAVSSGLGLAAAHGIIRQSKGGIHIESAPGKGTTVHMYLPLVEVPVPAETVPFQPGVVLIVDDESLVSKFASLILTKRGYTVVTASSGYEAILLLETGPSKIDMAIIDVVMPQMSGAQLAERLATLRPELPIVMMSGYPGDPASQDAAHVTTRRFLPKPFAAHELLEMVRSVLVAPIRAEPTH